MKTVEISEFKDHADRLFEELGASGEDILVTKAGRVVGRVGLPEPLEPASLDYTPGHFKDRMWIVGDLNEPYDNVDWEALKS